MSMIMITKITDKNNDKTNYMLHIQDVLIPWHRPSLFLFWIMITKITDRIMIKPIIRYIMYIIHYSGRVDTLAPSVPISILDNDNKDNR